MAVSKLKQYMTLVKTIESFSNGQAKLSENQTDSDSLDIILISITPNDGYYKNGKFDFEIDISDGYPETNPPKIRCLNNVYHPNIDQIDDYSEGDICLNLLDELWTPDLTLEDYVQGLLFMFYEPNVEDPLNPAFGGDECGEELRYNIRASMRGFEVDGIDYEQVLPDGYESDDGCKYEGPMKQTRKQRNDDSESDCESECSTEITPSLTLSLVEENTENSLMVYNANKADDQLSTIEEIDEATGQQVAVNVKPFSSILGLVLRFLRFLKPQASVNSTDALALRSKLTSVFVISFTYLAVRFGIRFINRTALFNIAR